MEVQKDTLSPDTLAAIRWLGMPEGTPFPLAKANPSPRPETMAQVELLPDEIKEWNSAFLEWTKACCRFHDGSLGSVGSLHVSYCVWADANGKPLGDRETFEWLLSNAGQLIQDGFVTGLILREDLDAVRL